MKNILILLVFVSASLTIFSCNDDLLQGTVSLNSDYINSKKVLVNNPDEAIDYIVDGLVEITEDVVIEPGTTIQFNDDAGFYVYSGSLNATGEMDNRIVFTSKNKVKGAWRGIIFESASTQNKLNYVTIEYAGGKSFNSNNDLGAVVLWASAKLTMDNLIITDSKSHGFNCNYGNADLIINNSKITNCDMAPVLILPSYMGKLGTSNDFKGNAEDFIHVALKTDALSGNNSIYNPSVPFRIFQTVSGYAELTINSGVTSFIDPLTVEFTDGTGIAVDENGTIKTSSSLDQILFTGVNKVAGAWRGIYFQFTEGDNRLENLVLSYAGATSDNAKGGVQMWANPKLYMADVDFVDIQGCAVLDRPKGAMDPVNPNLTLGGITYTNVSGGNYCKQ